MKWSQQVLFTTDNFKIEQSEVQIMFLLISHSIQSLVCQSCLLNVSINLLVFTSYQVSRSKWNGSEEQQCIHNVLYGYHISLWLSWMKTPTWGSCARVHFYSSYPLPWEFSWNGSLLLPLVVSRRNTGIILAGKKIAGLQRQLCSTDRNLSDRPVRLTHSRPSIAPGKAPPACCTEHRHGTKLDKKQRGQKGHSFWFGLDPSSS